MLQKGGTAPHKEKKEETKGEVNGTNQKENLASRENLKEGMRSETKN